MAKRTVRRNRTNEELNNNVVADVEAKELENEEVKTEESVEPIEETEEEVKVEEPEFKGIDKLRNKMAKAIAPKAKEPKKEKDKGGKSWKKTAVKVGAGLGAGAAVIVGGMKVAKMIMDAGKPVEQPTEQDSQEEQIAYLEELEAEAVTQETETTEEEVEVYEF